LRCSWPRIFTAVSYDSVRRKMGQLTSSGSGINTLATVRNFFPKFRTKGAMFVDFFAIPRTHLKQTYWLAAQVLASSKVC